MPDFVDLHIHTNHSDGRQSPEEVIDMALELNLKAVALTDHDALSGIAPAVNYARGKPIEVVPAIELSTAVTDDDIHILGYFIDPEHEQLIATIRRFCSIRLERGQAMVDRLAALGMPIDYSEIIALAGTAPIGRPHVADAMVRHGYVESYDQAFQQYLGLGGPVYVPKAKLRPAEAIELIHESGGVAVMAHPGLTGEDELIPDMVAAGLDGLEIFHPTHNRVDRKRYRRLAETYRLVCTGGSDAHNRTGRYGGIGGEKVPYEYLTALRTSWEKRRASG